MRRFLPKSALGSALFFGLLAANGAVAAPRAPQRLADGVTTHFVYHGWAQYTLWIDIQVPRQAASKQVGVLWTADDWQTVNTAVARFEKVLSNDDEQWGVDISHQGRDLQIEYAIFAVLDGQTVYDPRNNHFIGAMKDQEVKLTQGSTQKNPRTGRPEFVGRIKVQNLAYEKSVRVDYTLDHWKTRASLHASYLQGNDWGFAIALTPPNPVRLELTVTYSVLGRTIVDNNDGQGYAYQIGPELRRLYRRTQTLAGHELLTYDDPNINRTTRVTGTMNGKPLAYANGRFGVDTLDFAGQTELLLRLEAEDELGFRWQKEERYVTGDLLRPAAPIGAGELKWPETLRKKNGSLWIGDQDQQRFFRYDLARAELTSAAVETPVADLDLTPAGEVVLLPGLNADSLDVVDESGRPIRKIPFRQDDLRLSAFLETSPREIYVASLYENALLRLDFAGQVLGKIHLEHGIQRFRIVGDEIWVIASNPDYSGDHLDVYDLSGRLLRELLVHPQAQPGLEELLDHNNEIQIDDVAVSGDLIVFLKLYQVVVFDRHLRFLGKWTGLDLDGPENADPGEISSVAAALEIDGQRIFISDIGNKRITVLDMNPR